MSKSFSLYDLDKVLEHKNIKVEKPKSEESSERRTRRFTINDKSYKIDWYHNGCILEHNEVIIPFSKVAKKNTWPTDSKMNLQFYIGCDYELCCIISIEKWKKGEIK
jgi:hypothetical protein